MKSIFHQSSDDVVNHFKDRVSNDLSRNTRIGVAELLALENGKELRKLLWELYGENYQTEAEIPAYIRMYDASELEKMRLVLSQRTAALINSDGKISDYIKLEQYEIKALAIFLAEQNIQTPEEKIRSAESLLGTPIPGDTEDSQYARTCSASFWRKALSIRINRAREHFFLRLFLIGSKKELYASDHGVDMRASQLRAQQKWMRETVLVCAGPSEACESPTPGKQLLLSEIALGPEEKFAKLYSFINAVDVLGRKSNLSSAMVTITLEPEWHANPSKGNASWNGKSPRDAHKSFCKRWQSVLRDLHRNGIRLSGYRVAEPHGDACPHYHTWLLYRPEHERMILLTIMRYFPLKLKIRTKSAAGKSKNVIYDTRDDFESLRGRPAIFKRDGAQVEFSRINRKLSSGASYVMKYILKSLPASVSRNRCKLDENVDKNANVNDEVISRIDSFRAIWGINQGQLFGVAKCLTVWDELRRMQHPPENYILRSLWEKARGGTREGRVEKGASQRGDAVGFLEALGGLDAARNGNPSRKRLVIARLVESGMNRYGDAIKRTTGICLQEKERKRVAERCSVNGKVKRVWRTITETITSVVTKTQIWVFKKKNSNFNRLEGGQGINLRNEFS
jgi:hypothetical protein